MDSLITQIDSAGFLILAIALAALIESLAFVGIVVPGVAILFALATIASQLDLSLPYVLIAAFTGAVIGDSSSFILGRHFSSQLSNSKWINEHPEWLSKAETFFQRYGIISILIGRFIGPVRPVIPFVAGSCKMPFISFITVNLLSALAWAPFYTLPGYFLGSQLESHWLLHPLLPLLVLLLTLMIIFIKSHHWLDKLNQPTTTEISRERQGAVIMLLLAGLLFILVIFIQATGTIQDWNLHLFQLLQLDAFIENDNCYVAIITHLGDTHYLLLIGITICLYESYRKRVENGLAFLCLLCSCLLFNVIIKYAFQVERPFGIMPLSFSFPSGHSSGASALFFMLAVYFSTGSKAAIRRRSYLIATLPALLVAWSRLALGKHWPLDVIAGLIEGVIFAAFYRLSVIKLAFATKKEGVSQPALLIISLTLGYQISVF